MCRQRGQGARGNGMVLETHGTPLPCSEGDIWSRSSEGQTGPCAPRLVHVPPLSLIVPPPHPIPFGWRHAPPAGTSGARTAARRSGRSGPRPWRLTRSCMPGLRSGWTVCAWQGSWAEVRGRGAGRPARRGPRLQGSGLRAQGKRARGASTGEEGAGVPHKGVPSRQCRCAWGRRAHTLACCLGPPLDRLGPARQADGLHGPADAGGRGRESQGPRQGLAPGMLLGFVDAAPE